MQVNKHLITSAGFECRSGHLTSSTNEDLYPSHIYAHVLVRKEMPPIISITESDDGVELLVEGPFVLCLHEVCLSWGSSKEDTWEHALRNWNHELSHGRDPNVMFKIAL